MSPPASSLSVSLTPDQQAVFEYQAVKASKELVKFSQLDHKYIAQLSSQANNKTTVETCMSDGAVCARIVVQATLSEIAKLYLPTDHASFQEYSQRLYPGTVIEAQHVQTLRASRKRQLTAIRWTATTTIAHIAAKKDGFNHSIAFRRFNLLTFQNTSAETSSALVSFA
ncbi:unnamed protein product [Aphanomyces euteiches]